MPCYRFKTESGATGFICARGAKSPKPCHYCGDISDVLCDYPVGKTPGGRKKTCDIPMCFGCTQRGVSKNVDFCRKHFPEAKAAYERRQAKQVKTDESISDQCAAS